jgi:fermentation-respiration switch protein FrsA (DUF1100 family)
MKRRLATAVVAVLLSALAATWMAGSLLVAPRRHVDALPADMHGQSVEFPSASGATVRGWFLPGESGAGVIVLMHGVRGSRMGMTGRARFLGSAGYSVLIFDFQAHGESTGERITIGHLESRDAQAAVDFVRRRVPGEKVGLIGVSMGGAAALLATPRLDVQAWVLEEVYSEINQAITNRLTLRFGSWAEFLTPLLSWQLEPRLGVSPEDLRPIERIGGVTAPKLLIAAAEDRHTLLKESRRLFNAASEPKELWVIDGAQHVDLHVFAKEEYERRVLRFFRENLR